MITLIAYALYVEFQAEDLVHIDAIKALQEILAHVWVNQEEQNDQGTCAATLKFLPSQVAAQFCHQPEEQGPERQDGREAGVNDELLIVHRDGSVVALQEAIEREEPILGLGQVLLSIFKLLDELRPLEVYVRDKRNDL
jgi:hypothetical protein